MRLGHAARKAGRSAEALAHYRSALEQEPGSAEANSVYGLMLLQLGRAGEAEAPLRKAVEIAPSHAALRMNLAQWLAHQGDVDEAVRVVAVVVADEPQHWWAWERLGELRARQGKFGEAAANFRRASELQRNDPSLLFKWARSCFDDGHADEALRILREASGLSPANAAILRLYTDLHESRADWPSLEKAAMDWAAVHPRDPAAWRSLAKAQWETGYFRQAMENFRHALRLGERDAQSLATYARLCMSALEFESAAKALDEAEGLDPANNHMLSGKAILLMVSGRYDEAETYCRRALAANRRDASAYKALAQLTSGHLSKDEMVGLESLVDDVYLRLQDRITGAFALADCRETQGDAAKTFAAYERANRLALEYGAAEGLVYDRAAREKQIDELITQFDSVPEAPARESTPRPLFIVGMPRSGTTLIESVIGAHSKVFACGERMAVRWIMQEYLSQARGPRTSGVDAATWDQWRQFFWQGIPREHGAEVVTDKNPWNFDAIGLIIRLFPDARVIHVRRNPVETGLSIFRNQFPKSIPYANRLEDIGHYYGEYARLMAHWQHVAAGRFTTIQYEDFIRHFDAAGPALVAACGLRWEPACRNFWESRRVISTMSTMQARRPLENRGSRAERYSAQLAPLVDSLRKAGVDLESGELRANS